MGDPLQRWRPQTTVTGHIGETLSEDLDFFVPPPPEIGPLLSAYSAISLSKRPSPYGWPLFGTLAGFLLVAAICLFALNWRISLSTLIVAWGIGMIFGAPPGLLCGFLINRARVFTCNYIGKNGVASYRWNRRPEQQQNNVLLFQNAAECRCQEVRNSLNGIYTGTDFTYTWTNYEGKTIYVLKGGYVSAENDLRSDTLYGFARAAENAWSALAFERAKAELARNGAVRFNLTGGNYLVVGQGFIEVSMNGQTARCSPQEIGRVTIQQGIITLRRVDAKSGFLGFGSSGIFSFKYADIGNARLFLLLFDDLVGVDFS